MSRPWRSWLGAGYFLAVLLVTMNVLLAQWGTVHIDLLVGKDSRNVGGLIVLALAGAVVLIVASRTGSGNRLQCWMVAALALWLVPVAISIQLHGVLSDSRFWLMAVIVPAIGAAGILVDPGSLQRVLLVLGWIAGWGSVFVGVLRVTVGWPPVVIAGEERFARWLSMVGIDVEQAGFLNGLMLGRVYVGLTCGLLLVYTVRVLLTRSRQWWWWLSPVGLVTATLWSFSRTGLLIMVLGLLAALVPWQRVRPAWLVVALFAVLLLPLAASPLLERTGITDGTTVWRFDLWQDYVTRPGMWSPFGIGPQPSSLAYADHAHQQLLEAQATGGWLSLAGCVAFLVLACFAARRAADVDNRTAIAVLFGMAGILQLDVVTYTNTYTVVNNAQALTVVILVSAAGLRDQSRASANLPKVPLTS